MDADVQLVSYWEECFFRKRGEIGVVLLSFFSDTYFIFMFVSRTAKRCIWSPNQESHTPPPNSQLAECLSLWSLPKRAVGRAHWTDDPHLKQKKQRITVSSLPGRVAPMAFFMSPPPFTSFVQLIFWLIFSAARTNASLIKFPHHSLPFIQLVGSLAPQQPSAAAFSVNAQLLLASPKKSVTY